MTRYRCVDARRAEGFAVAAACTAAAVSTSAYYAWASRRDAGPSERERAEAELVAEIRQVHEDSGGTYGSPRVTVELWRRGRRVNHKRVEALMARHGIVGHRPRRRRGLTQPDETAVPAPDLVGRLSDPDEPDRRWCGDITYIPTDEGWLYLASVLDLGSRAAVGYAMGERHDAPLVVDALQAAVAFRGRDHLDDAAFHSDRGSEYTSGAFASACERLGLRRSMGRTGSCLDNAVAESFFATLKVELCDRKRFRTRAEARQAIFRWINYYNRRRLHSSLGYLTPLEYEQQFILAQSNDSVLSSTSAA